MDSILDQRIQTGFLTISGVYEGLMADLDAHALLGWALNSQAIGIRPTRKPRQFLQSMEVGNGG